MSLKTYQILTFLLFAFIGVSLQQKLYNCNGPVTKYTKYSEGYQLYLANWFVNVTSQQAFRGRVTIKNITNAQSCPVDTSGNNYNYQMTISIYYRRVDMFLVAEVTLPFVEFVH